MCKLTLFILFLTIWVGNSVAQNTSMNATRTNRQLTMCYLIERNGAGLIYDYNKAAAALDMALEYANNNILPSHLRLSRYRMYTGHCQFEKAKFNPIIFIQRLSGYWLNLFRYFIIS